MASRVTKPKTQRGKRFLLSREAKLKENTKSVMFIRGEKTSEIVTHAMRDICALKKPNATMLSRKNMLRPFEDQTQLEFFSQKCDSSLMVFGSHSKKRPHNLVFGSFHDHRILDMVELGIDKYVPIADFKTEKIGIGTKPCIFFSGEEFDNKVEFQRLKTLLVDFWRGENVQSVRLQGLEHVIQITSSDEKIYFRSYRVLLKKSGVKTPRIEVEEIGPSFNFSIRRTRLAEDSLYKQTLKQAKQLKKKTVKNVDYDVFGAKSGRIHMQTQDFDYLQTRKMKGLKRNKKMPDQTEPGVKKQRAESTENADTS